MPDDTNGDDRLDHAIRDRREDFLTYHDHDILCRKCMDKLYAAIEAVAGKMMPRWVAIIIASASMTVALAAMSLTIMFFLNNRATFMAENSVVTGRVDVIKSVQDVSTVKIASDEARLEKVENRLVSIDGKLGEINVSLASICAKIIKIKE
jgi:hypothetical protein